jgi:uncharacterized membrane protein YcaP (DUF421 family)
MDYLIIAAKSIAVYVFIVLAIRFFGKKELAQLSVIDLVFILLIANSVQNAMVGQDSSLQGGLVSASALFLVNFLLKKAFFKHPEFSKIIQGEPIILIYEGKIKQKALEEADFSILELEAAAREHGVESLEKVSLAVLEVDGNISILSDNFAQKTTKKRRKYQHKIV